MHRLFVLLSWLAISLARAEEIPFQATSIGTAFAVAGELSGTFEIDRDNVVVTITGGHLVRQPCPYTGERKVEEITVMLAGWTKSRRSFTSHAYSRPIKIERNIALGEIIPLEPTKIEIPVGDLDKEQLKKTWLAFSITNLTKDKEGKPRGGSCYIHTTTSLACTPTGFPAEREPTASGELKILETSLAPALAGLTPTPKLSFIPAERMMQADFRAKSFKASDSPRSRGRTPSRYEFGPDEQGFVLTAQFQDAGSPNSLSALATPEGMNWKTDIGITPVTGTPKQVSWALSHGANLDPAVLEKLRQGLQDLTATAE